MADHKDNENGLEFLTDMQEDAREEGIRHLKILIVLSILLVFVSVLLIVHALSVYGRARQEYDKIREETVAAGGADLAGLPLAAASYGPGKRPEGAVLTIDFDALRETNEDVIAWLHVPALEISYPVVQTSDNVYYLTHTVERAENANGAIFMECANAPDFSYGNTFLYGHNSADGQMFGTLYRFGTDKTLREEHPFFYIYRADGAILKYAIYSYYYAETASRSFVYFTDEAGYDYYVGLTIGLSDEDIEADFSKRGRIVTLATCYGGTGTPYRYLVHGVLVEEGEAD